MGMKMIPFVNAAKFPEDVLDYCVKHGIQTHGQNDVTFVENDGNPLAKWLREEDIIFGREGTWIAILST